MSIQPSHIPLSFCVRTDNDKEAWWVKVGVSSVTILGQVTLSAVCFAAEDGPVAYESEAPVCRGPRRQGDTWRWTENF